MMPRKNLFQLMVRRKNNKGSSLVLVIVAIAFIGILTAIILNMCLINYRMKYMDLSSKDNFYTAENALDEIKTGLGIEVSDALSASYIEVMQQYSQTNAEERSNQFQYKYLERLRGVVRNPSDVGKYNIDLLKSYLKQTAYDSTTGIGAMLDGTIDPKLEATQRGLILKNLVVKYIDDKEYVTYIKTDILLSFPSIDFTQTSSMPDLLSFGVVANKDFLASATGTTTIDGSVYGGKDGMTVSNGSKLVIQNAKQVITNTNLTVESNGELTLEDTATLWAKNVLVDTGNLNLKGYSNVADDLTIKGTSSAVTLAGEYYGFGNTATAKSAESLQGQLSEIEKNPSDYSSSVIVNGSDSRIDMSSLKKLVLSGNAYISTSSKSVGANTNVDVMLGESLTVKSNQVMYMIPAECIGEGMQNGGANPMNGTQYSNLVAEMAGNEIVNFDTKIKGLNKSLKEMGVSSYQKAFYPVSGGSMVYFFLKFDNEDVANNYFRAYYGIEANKKRLDDYLKLYVDEINIQEGSLAKFSLNGNVMKYVAGEVSSVDDTRAEDATDRNYLDTKQATYQDIFAAQGIMLVEGYHELSDTEKAKDVFGNLVLESDMVNYIGSNMRKVFSNTGMKAVLVDNKAGVTFETSEYNSDELRLVIATGNVLVDTNFKGLIIAKGNVTLKAGGSITASPEDVAKAIQIEGTEGGITKCPMDFLVSGSDYVLSGAVGAAVTPGTADETINSSDLVIYENWTKE